MMCPAARRGRPCRRPVGHAGFHAYAGLRARGARAIREAPAIDAFREAVRARAGGLCEVWTDTHRRAFCGVARAHPGVHAHHVLPRSLGGAHKPENGLWLCARAHHEIHAHPRESRLIGLSRPSPSDDAQALPPGDGWVR